MQAADGSIRKIVTVVDETRRDGERSAEPAYRRAAVGAVVRNPWHGRGYVDDLQPEVRALSPTLAVELAARLNDALGGPAGLEAFGKCAVTGLEGELEHGAALIHTPNFGDVLRERVDGSSVIAHSDTRAGAGAVVFVPMWHKTAATTRSHYQTIEFRVADAPGADEILVIAAGAAGPRPFHRIGDRSTDAVSG